MCDCTVLAVVRPVSSSTRVFETNEGTFGLTRIRSGKEQSVNSTAASADFCYSRHFSVRHPSYFVLEEYVKNYSNEVSEGRRNGLCGGQSGSGTCFAPSTSVSPCQYRSTDAI
jgi:hypothetical protein